MATDYDSPRKTDEDLTEDSLQELQARRDELCSRLSPAWRTVVGRSPIESCSLSFKFRCPQRWEKLRRTEAAAVRFCEAATTHRCVRSLGSISRRVLQPSL